MSGIRRVLTLAGVPNSEMGFLDVASGLAEGLVKVRPDRLIQDGERLPLAGWNLRAVHTPGHSPGHLCFYEADRRVLLTGDHLLPRITPNIGVAALTGEGTLAEFMASLDRIVDLDGHVDEVMPAHEYRFAGAGARAQILKQHHDRRLAHLHGLLSVPMTAWEVAERVEWSRPWSDVPPLMRPAAVAEVLAHLVLLEQRGAVHRASGRATDSAWIWARTQTTH